MVMVQFLCKLCRKRFAVQVKAGDTVQIVQYRCPCGDCDGDGVEGDLILQARYEMTMENTLK